jgi:hypothetical protein
MTLQVAGVSGATTRKNKWRSAVVGRPCWTYSRIACPTIGDSGYAVE